MYACKLMEFTDVGSLFANPRHPYTIGLMESIPVIGRQIRDGRLKTISGVVPSLFNLPKGCLFSDRCPDVFSDCHRIRPEMVEVNKNHKVRCLKYA
jgi:oligopeptide/dipeptide ABC transporter ATP-binding protein